ncbi:hypothetical protein CDD83_1754 [Cordyceps sp. RAO-2017]|nr:hypothetical protein CDD83_1754 [Cordyceps sp. RAO-2017]
MPRRPVRSAAFRAAVVPHASTTPLSSASTTPLSSAYPSTYASEVETEDEINALPIASLTLNATMIPPAAPKRRLPSSPFLFLSLPSELRIKIYQHYFDATDVVLDLDPANYKRIHKLLGLMRVCKQIHAEATHYFYSTRPFRLFPTYPGRFFKSKKPLLARLKASQRARITSLELRLGPGWNAPPRGWVVNDALGLQDCVNAHKVTVFVECDPSDGVFKGFRRSEGFYESFSRKLLASVLEALPAVHVIEFDAWSSVKKSGAMMHGLLDVAAQSKRLIRWGPERGWTDADDDDDDKAISTNQAVHFAGTITIQGYAPNVVAAA